jgi:hypothetical protein
MAVATADVAENGAAARAAAVAETFVMEGTSGEQGRIKPRGALSRPHPAQIRPGRSLPLAARYRSTDRARPC